MKLYLCMDFYRGGELFFHLQKMQRFPENTVRLMVSEVVLAIGHLHANKIIYRDLKPENILIDREGHLAITDFGLAKFLKEGEKARTFCGTPEYLAPEVIRNIGHDKAVDWWSIGILCYELAIGIPPFYSQNCNDMYTKIQHGKLSWRRRERYLSKELMDFVTKLLVKDPVKRMGTSPADVDELTDHPFLAKLDMDVVFNKETRPAYMPTFQSRKTADLSNFEAQPVKETICAPHMLHTKAGDDGFFENFTFQPTSVLGGAGGAT